jgi:tRNA1(Val) A37 N6-methylase TrmN6
VKLRRGDKVVDLGTGSGVIPLLLAYKNKGVEVTGIEIQPEAAELARRNVEYNHLQDQIKIINQDLCQLWQLPGMKFMQNLRMLWLRLPGF